MRSFKWQNMKSVDPTEFSIFLRQYPRLLERDNYCGMVTFNDFELGNWPESAIARCEISDDGIETNFKILADFNG